MVRAGALLGLQVVGDAGGRLAARIQLGAVAQLELLREPALTAASEHPSQHPAHVRSMHALEPKIHQFAGCSRNRVGRFTIPYTSPMPEPDQLLEVAVEAAGSAGRLLLERFNRPATGVERKSSSTDMVSDADRDAEAAIRSIISQRRPDDAILGEESGVVGGATGLRWVVDPLDGTTNYLYGQPVWSVSIACEDAAGAVAAIVLDPCSDEAFTAVRGGGARLNDRPIAVSDAAELQRSLIGTGFSYVPAVREGQARSLIEILPRVRDVRRAGSAAIDLAWVACGRLDGYYELGSRHWDRAAGVLLVAEAGGVVSPLTPVRDSGDGVLAAGPALHADLAALVAPALLH